jgi:hypothetical protein
MRRLAIVALLLVTAALATAQDTTPLPPTPTLAPVLVPSDTPPPPTPLPTMTPLPDVRALLPDAAQADAILLAARSDMEILANATLGAANRPVGWNGTYDTTNVQMALHARLDLEILASELLAGTRPPGWFGVQQTNAYAIARDVRHDLELLADTVVEPNVRPPNWIGDDPIMRCNRSTQTLVILLDSRGLYDIVSTPASATYCFDVMMEISTFTEMNLLDAGAILPSEDADAPVQPGDPQAPVTITSADAVGYFDRAATERAGVIPAGTIVTPIARSYAQFSRMTLVRGDGFQLFIDYQDTSMEVPQFDLLGDINVITVTTGCEAEWCGTLSE